MAGTLAFVDVTVLPMDRDRVLTGQTVIIRDGRIAAIGPKASVKIPADAQRIDGRGKFLMPGRPRCTHTCSVRRSRRS